MIGKLLRGTGWVVWELLRSLLLVLGLIVIGYWLFFALPIFLALMVMMLIVLVAIFVRLGHR